MNKIAALPAVARDDSEESEDPRQDVEGGPVRTRNFIKECMPASHEGERVGCAGGRAEGPPAPRIR